VHHDLRHAPERPQRRATATPGRIWPPTAFTDRIFQPSCHGARVSQKQFFPKTLFKQAVLNPPVTFWGTSENMAEVENQFIKYTYPIPESEGGTEIRMIWTDNPCLTTCWNEGHKMTEAFRSPKIECVVAQHQWLENDTMFADIILPVSTLYEMDDMMTNSAQGGLRLTFRKR
jgi:trimethylamine-N-oxide reductase (cytochrome c)